MAVHGGRFGDAILDGLRRWRCPRCDLVPAGGPRPPPDADVLVALADEAPAIEPPRSPRGSAGCTSSAPASTASPSTLVGDRILTCSRGAGAPAIAEFVLAAMLAFEKRLPESWITAPPAQWNTADLGGLEGRTLGRRRPRGHRHRGGPAGPRLRHGGGRPSAAAASPSSVAGV